MKDFSLAVTLFTLLIVGSHDVQAQVYGPTTAPIGIFSISSIKTICSGSSTYSICSNTIRSTICM